ncbi:MAG TPA: hypothetical protein VFA72_08985, partial [Burkholderiales bacterium]|nr:hypothetical protein [Burkholderiales bacterium]
DITRCHVTVAREQGSHRKGNRYSVMVEVRLPRQHDLAVRKQKQIHDMQTQLPAIINQAFGAIEKQLKKTVALRRHEEKLHDAGEPHGLVEKLFEDAGYEASSARSTARSSSTSTATACCTTISSG